MFKGLKFSPLLVAVILCVGLVAYLYLPKDVSQQSRQSNPTLVRVHQAVEEEFEVVVEGLGTGKANESVLITTQTSDIVQNILFDDGDRVKAGQVLLTLIDLEEKARLAALDVDLQEANRQLKRVANLAKKNAASEQLLDEQQAKVNALIAEMNVLKTQMLALQVRAPFEGVLGLRQVSVGALVRPGDAITTLDDLSTLKVDFNIAEVHLPSVAIGQNIRATSIAYPGETFTGQILSIGSRVDAATRAIQIRANINNDDFKLRPGMLLQINLQKKLLNTLVLPEATLVPIEDKQFVFVVRDQAVTRTQVKIGLRKPGIVQIVSGLKEGDLVVVEGALKLRDGSKVKVLNADEIKE
ncbi:efflux RND transporter periplasmic adaptor subunit [uncultured Paraglaciecola sp.]|uniref:efflux RND transporter periplasmic adaptor subunit n=1 Tax=uncultured Paraglaciecola sp. TaxID=1765024 RepID=UPI0025D9057A|nr:efflux RND transporter periplasmic adaptor subunit [uncultured Paraglaciecola sp.]